MKTTTIFLTAMVLAACGTGTKNSNDYVLKGQLGNVPDSTLVFLVHYDDDQNAVKDSVYIVNNTFEFRGTETDPLNAYLVVDREGKGEFTNLRGISDYLSLYIEPGTLTVSSPDSVKNAAISGSVINEDQARWKELTKAINYERDELYRAYREATPEQRSSEDFNKNISDQLTALSKKEKELATEYINSNPDSYFALDRLFSVTVGYSPDAEAADSLYSSFSERVRNTKTGRTYADRVEAWKATSVGAVAPDFTQNDPDGKAISLSDFRGKYVLLDFWASWCGPCRQENPNVVKAYNEYKDKNFTVFGVSLDNEADRDKWLKAIEDDNLGQWPNVSDLKGWKNEASVKYAIRAIPANFLLDPEGKIIARNLRGAELEEKLAEYLD